MQFELRTALTVEPPAFILTCTSTGGPATTLTWERDEVELMDSDEYIISQTVEDTETAEYSNQLTVTGRLTGEYQCTVNSDGGGSFRVLLVESKFICMANNLHF